MQWFRWIGLIVFVVLVGGGSLLVWLFLDKIVENVIEDQGSSLVGAKVELDSVDIQLWPTKFALNELQVTNPKQTDQNLFQTQLVEFDLDSSQLLLDKLIVNEMSVMGLQMNTHRETDGALPGVVADAKEESKEEDDSFKFPKLEVPNVKDVVKEDELITVQRARELDKSFDEKEAYWKGRIAGLPDKKKMDGYKAEVKELKSAKSVKDKLKAVKKLDEVRKKIKKDGKDIRSARDDLKKDIKELKQQVAALKAAPREDVDRILADLGLSEGGLEGLARVLFGDQITSWVQQGLNFYELVKPYLDEDSAEATEAEVAQDRSSGRDIKFPEDEPLPDVLIRLINLSGAQVASNGEQFNYVGRVIDVTDQQDIIDRPTTLELKGESDRKTSFQVFATFDHRDPKQSKDSLNLKADNVQVKDWQLSRGSLPLTLGQAGLNVAASGDFQNGELDSQLTALFSQAQIALSKEESLTEVQTAVVNGLKNADSFKVDVAVTGNLKKPKISVSSDVTKPIKESIKGLVANKRAELKQKISAEVEDKLQEQMAGLSEKLKKFEELEKKVSQSDKDLSDLL